MPNNYQSNLTHLIKIFGMSLASKKRCGWSRECGAGFIAEDIIGIELMPTERRQGGENCPYCGKKMGAFPNTTSTVRLIFAWGAQVISVSDLNLRETEEAWKFCRRLRKKEIAEGLDDN